MPEITEREPLAEAFFQLRIDAPHEIDVPGTAAARRTVTRRRTTRIAAMALVLVAGLVGIGYVGGSGRDAPTHPAQPSPSAGATDAPTLGEDALQKLGVDALAKLGYKPEISRPARIFGPVTASSANFTYALGTAASPFPHGTYRLFAACLGQGSVEVHWNASGASGSITVNCAAATNSSASFVLAEAGPIGIGLKPDAQAQGRAGIAVTVTDPLQVTATNKISEQPFNVGGGGSGFAESPRMDVSEDSLTPGTYTLAVACAGKGTLKATFSIGTATTTATVRCSDTPSTKKLQLHAPKGATPRTVQLEPDAAALGAAGYAYTILKG